MQDIQKIDTNFIIQTTLTKTDIRVYDVCQAPFQVYGLIPPQNKEDRFRRMPLEQAEKVSEGVALLHANTAGGRVRFATNSSYIAIHAELDKVAKFSHMPLSGTAGFDLYATADGREKYLHSYIPPQSIDTDRVYESELVLSESNMQEYTLNFPLYSDVVKLYIILEESAEIQAASEYAVDKPVIFYGSSITQGGCASRPGNSYENIISRRLHMDYINLGFSGKARGELPMAEYIAGMEMSAFVYDYDHNAPDLEHLKNTHEAFFKAIREKKPTLPIICVSKPFGKAQIDIARRELIKGNVEKWRASGDDHVYFIDGYSFREAFGAGDSIVVDGCHPNDLGFWCMAELIGNKLQEVLKEAVG